MSLNSLATANLCNNNIQPLLLSKTEFAFMAMLENILDNAFQASTKSLTNFDITPPAGTLHFPLTLLNGVKILTPENIGSTCANYWSLAIAKGSPVSCNGIDSVINDASKIAAPIASELRALSYKSITSISTPYYFEFIDIIFRNVKTIVWTIKESDSTCNSTLTGTVS